MDPFKTAGSSPPDALVSRPRLPAWCRIVRTRPSLNERKHLAAAPRCSAPDVVWGLLRERLEREEVEVLVAVVLDTQHRVLALAEVTRGTANSSLVHPRELFRLAVAYGAAALVVAHNHPSGDPTPSDDDRRATADLKAAGTILGIPLLDHIVVGRDCYVSFAQLGSLR
jgi:DNA repair protein RadC